MRSISLVVYLVCSLSFAVEQPTAGKPYTLVYDPSKAKILLDAKEIWVIYVFDYWGSAVKQKLRGEGPQDDLFGNVLNPDYGRMKHARMIPSGGVWKAEIPIPADASLLSYYVTDSRRTDANDRRTFVSLVCNTKGDPVRGARFRNVDFLIMAGKGLPDILENLRKETEEYPDNFLAHLVYWRFRLFDTISPDTLTMLMAESDRYFAKLREQYGDTVLNYKALSLHDINRICRLSLYDRYREPPVVDLIKKVNAKIVEAIEAIPPPKRLRVIVQLEPLARASARGPSLLTENDQQKQRVATFAEFVGQPAPDFSFETVKGQKHRLSDFRGRYVLLDFWGSWCGPCVAEIPNLVKIHNAFRDRGLVMISISNDASASKWDRQNLVDFTAKKGMNWMQVLDDNAMTIHKLYKIQFWPNLFLIGKDGNVMQRESLRGEELAKALSTALAR